MSNFIINSYSVAPLWTPADTTTKAWYDADDSSTITESGGAVSQWDDKSGNGHNLTQATGAAQPTTGTRTQNSKNVLDFDGGDHLDNLSFSMSNANFSVFMVRTIDDTNSGNRYLTISRATRTQGQYNEKGGGQSGHRYLEDQTVSYTNDTSPHLTSYVKSGTTSQNMWLDGTVQTENTSTITTWTSERIIVGAQDTGGASAMNGAIAEIVVVPSAVSTALREKIEGYLAHKWGITGSLPGGHPYKSAPPTV